MPKDYSIPRRRIAEAYDRWHNLRRREMGVERASAFREELAALLRLAGREHEMSIVPGNRQRWSEWRKSDGIFVDVSLTFCVAIRHLAKIDLTPDGMATHAELTRVVTIAHRPSGPLARLMTNEPENGNERYEVDVPRVAFRRSEAIRVTREWIGGVKVGKPVDIGSVYFGLRQARIILSATGTITPRFERLRPREPQGQARAEGVVLSDDPQAPGTWIVNSIDGEMMDGSVYLQGLADVWHDPKSEMTVVVEADSDAIEADFRLNGENLSSETRRSQARTHLIERVLSLAVTRTGRRFIMSCATVEKQ